MDSILFEYGFKMDSRWIQYSPTKAQNPEEASQRAKVQLGKNIFFPNRFIVGAKNMYR